jgi:hypothetical protein
MKLERAPMTKRDWTINLLLTALLLIFLAAPWPGHVAFFARLERFTDHYLPLPSR